MAEGMYETYLRNVAAGHLARRRELVSALRTREQLLARQAEIRRVFGEGLGAFPQHSPLLVQTTSRLERDGYEVEVLTFEPAPGVIVTGNLYLPRKRDERKPFPGVLCPVGHWLAGKAQEEHQRLGQLFARRGIAALVYDGPGQGERVQFFDVTLKRSWLGKPVAAEQAHLGNILSLTGHHLSAMLLWEAMRGLDLLVEHAGVDARRLGATGAAAGAGLTRLLCCMDERLKAAALVGDEAHPQTLEGSVSAQPLLGALANGITTFDLLAPFAPRPLLLAYGSNDPNTGRAQANLEELRGWYERLGAGNQVELEVAQGPAGYLKEFRTRAVEFFARAFELPAERVKEPEASLEAPATLSATETGQVMTSLNTVDLFTFHRECAKDLPPKVVLPEPAAIPKLQDSIRACIRRHVRMPEPSAEVQAEVEGHSSDWGLAVEKGRLIVEEGIYLPYSFYSEPENDQGRAARPTVLALHERGMAAISAQGPWMTSLATAGFNILSIDVRGIGETRVEPSRDESDPYDALLLGAEAAWARAAWNMNLSLFGGRVFDVLRAISFLRTRWDVNAEQISLIGVGRGALWALYAAALDEKVSRVALLRGLSTYRSLILKRRHNHHASLFLPGVLQDYDLPQVAACVAPRSLMMINAVNQRRERQTAERTQSDYAFASELYGRKNAASAFQIATTDSASETLRALSTALGLPGDVGPHQ